MTPNALAKAICWSTLVRDFTRSTAWPWWALFAAMPQQLLNSSVPLPAGPAGSSTTLVLTLGKSLVRAPRIQLPSMVMAPTPLPSASPPHPVAGLVSVMYFSDPADIIFFISASPARFCGVSAVTLVPSLLITQPPAWTMKAPPRLMSLPITRPVTLPLVSFLATVSRPAQSFGMSASVRPALAHRSVLMTRARVE